LVSTGPTVQYKILGLYYKRALFDLQFVHNLFWLNLNSQRNKNVSGSFQPFVLIRKWFLFLYFKYWYFRSLKHFWDCDLILSMSLNFIKAWRNDKWYNKRVLIWCFTLVLIKINYGQIGDQTGLFYNTNPVFYTGQSVQWKPTFFRTELIFTGFVHRTDMFGNLWKCIAHRINDIHHNMYMNFMVPIINKNNMFHSFSDREITFFCRFLRPSIMQTLWQ
jgi:hypothetical protein